MTRGLPSNRRTHARNYIQEEANKRLQEVTKPYQQQGLNALGVDYYEVLVYLRQASSQVCTCKQIQTETELGAEASVSSVTRSGIAETHEINIDWNRPVFGEPGEARFEEDDGTELSDYEFDDHETPVSNHLFESAADCGICYRTGYVPGMVQYGKHRVVLTTYDVVGESAYTIDRSQAPHVFHKLAPQGYIQFEIQVPKYFKSAQYSVRNNTRLVDDLVFAGQQPVTLAYLRSQAGKKIVLTVSAEEFTHVVVVFDLGTAAVHANIAQMSRATDWTMFNTIGNLNVVLPMTIPEVTTGTIVHILKNKLSVVVTDVTYLRTSAQNNLDWSVNTRVCQPQEAAMRIAKHRPFI